MKTLPCVILLLSTLATVRPAAAFDLEGDWPEEPEHVTLSVEHEATSRALRLAAESAGLDLVATLPADPPCTVRVNGAAFPDVLTAILGEQPVTVRRTGRMIVVRPATTPAAGPTATPPAPPPVPAIPAIPVPGVSAPTPPPVPAVPTPPPPVPPRSEGLSDRVSFTGDITVRAGERVRDVVTMGGDALIEGEATGDVVTMGGDIEVGRTGVVHGDLVTMGGDIDIEAGGLVHGQQVQTGGGPTWDIGATPPAASNNVGRWFSDVAGSAACYALLFLLGLVLLGLSPDRLDTLRLALVKHPARTTATGIVGFIAAVVLIVVLCFTLIGIPAAVLLALALPVSMYVGMAAAASVIGALLPSAKLKDRPVMQLAAGVAVLFFVSLVPFIGDIATVAAAVAGFGTVVLTRFGKLDPSRQAAAPSVGPYR